MFFMSTVYLVVPVQSFASAGVPLAWVPEHTMEGRMTLPMVRTLVTKAPV